jgi:hypothetical protein
MDLFNNFSLKNGGFDAFPQEICQIREACSTTNQVVEQA